MSNNDPVDPDQWPPGASAEDIEHLQRKGAELAGALEPALEHAERFYEAGKAIVDDPLQRMFLHYLCIRRLEISAQAHGFPARLMRVLVAKIALGMGPQGDS
jgi:hypothetical protein